MMTAGANSISGPVGVVVGGILMFGAGQFGRDDLGPRVAILVVGTIGLVGAAWLLRGVHPRRGPGVVAASAEASSA